MLNTFRDVLAFVEFHEYGDKGQLKIFNASETMGEDGNDGGEVIIFLNYEEVGRFKAKRDALAKIQSLIESAPKAAIKDFNEYRDSTFKSLL